MLEPSCLIDFDHLARQCFDDAALQRELLALFDVQCARLRPVVLAGRGAERLEAVHTLRGGALAVGATRVAYAAAALEAALSGRTAASVPTLAVRLDEAVVDTRRTIASCANARPAITGAGPPASLAKAIPLP